MEVKDDILKWKCQRMGVNKKEDRKQSGREAPWGSVHTALTVASYVQQRWNWAGCRFPSNPSSR